MKFLPLVKVDLSLSIKDDLEESIKPLLKKVRSLYKSVGLLPTLRQALKFGKLMFFNPVTQYHAYRKSN